MTPVWIALGTGLLIGAPIGAVIMGILLAGKLNDMPDQLDAWEATRWR